MAKFIETSPGVRINADYASDAIKKAADAGTYKYVEGDGGIKLPEKPELPNKKAASDFSMGSPELDKLLSTSAPAINRSDITAQTTADFAQDRVNVESKFDRKLSGLKEERRAQKDSLSGALGVRRRFSTSAQEFIKYVDEKNAKEIAELEVQKEDALKNFDYALAKEVDRRIADLRTSQQQEFENALKIFELSKGDREADAAESKSFIQSEKDAAIIEAMDSGLTDIGDIFKAVRGSRDDITLDDVKKSFESMGEALGMTSGAAEKLTGDAKNFFLLKGISNALPSTITTLPENQQLGAYIRWIETGAGAKTKTTTGIGGGNVVPGMDSYNANILVSRLGKSIYGKTISDKESERIEQFVIDGMKKGKSEGEILDDVLGYQITRNRPLADGLKNSLMASSGPDGLAGFDMNGLARLINAGQDLAAVQKVENFKMQEALELSPNKDAFVTEADVTYLQQKTDEINALLGTGWANEVGAFTGSINAWLNRKFGLFGESTKIKSKLTSIIAGLANKRGGSAITEEEWDRLIAPNVPAMNESAQAWVQKLAELVDDPLTKLNAERQMVFLPSLEKTHIKNPNSKSALYSIISPELESSSLKQELDDFKLSDDDFWFKSIEQ